MGKNKSFPGWFAKHPLLTATGLTLLLFILGFFFFTPFFQTNDDVVMSWITRGLGMVDQPSEFLILINVVVGLTLKDLYTAFPHVPWYALALFSIYFISVWAFLAAYLSRPRAWWANVFFIILGIPVFFHCYAWPQYTVFCFLAAQAGLFLLINPFRSTQVSLTIAGFLLLSATLIRLEPALFSMVLGLPYFLAIQRSEKNGPTVKARWITLAVTAMLILMSVGFDRYYYHFHAGWQEAKPYYQERFSLTEIKVTDYAKQEKAFREVGWSENDYRMFGEGFYYDKPFDLGTLKKLDSLLSVDFEVKGALFKNLFNNDLVLFPFLVLATCGLIAAFWHFPVLKHALWIFLLVGLLFVINKIVARVLWPQLFFAILILLFCSPPQKLRKPKPWLKQLAMGFAILLALDAGWVLWEDHRSNEPGLIVKERIANTFKTLSPRKDQLFVIWGSAFPFVGFPAFDTDDHLENFRFIWMWWLEKTPYTEERLAQFKIQNFLKDMVDRPDIFWLMNDRPPYFENYLKEHEGLTVTRQRVFHGYFDVYRLVSKR